MLAVEHPYGERASEGDPRVAFAFPALEEDSHKGDEEGTRKEH